MGLLFAFAIMGLPLAYAVWTLFQDKDELEIVHRAQRDPTQRDSTEHRPAPIARDEPQQPDVAAQDPRPMPAPSTASLSAGA